MKLGCHAVLFKEMIKTDTETILREFSSMGYKGVEIGSRFFGTEDRERLQEKLDKYDMELSAMHVGSPLVDWLTKAQELTSSVDRVADFMSEMPNKNVLMSGNQQGFYEEANIKQIALAINEAAKRCLDKGVTLHYHNHDLEFMHGAKIYKALAEYAPDINFGLDLGWIYVGGGNPSQVLREQSGRVTYVHIRDTLSVGVRDFAEVGEGSLNLPVLMEQAKATVGINGWGVVEFDKGEAEMRRCRNAKAYLDTIL